MHSHGIVEDYPVQALLSVWSMRLQVAHLRSLTLPLWSHVSPLSSTKINRCHQINTDNISRHIHMLCPFCLTCTHMHSDALIYSHRPPHMHIHILYIHRHPTPYPSTCNDFNTYNLSLIRRRSHIETHAYQASHPCRCSGACLASIPLPLHPSLASNPSLRCLPSVDQRCKTLPPAP